MGKKGAHDANGTEYGLLTMGFASIRKNKTIMGKLIDSPSLHATTN